MKKLCFSLTIGISLCLCLQASVGDSPIGWAAVNALGQNGTTGGGNGAVVHVNTKSALVTYAGSTTPYTIIVDSTSDNSWTNTAIVNVVSHKTIIGANAGIVFDGFGLSMNTASNVIIRNLTIKNVNPTDAFAMRTSHHVWIDHCDFSACTDGLADVTIGSDYVTISWTKFHDHDKVSIANSGTGHFEDVGKCKVTYHHNWFADTTQRNPRVGYGLGHVFNNYYTNISSYCVGYHTHASVLVESNYFLKSAAPLNQMYTANTWEAAYADSKSVGNIFNQCTGNTTATGNAFDPEFYYNYKFTLDTSTNMLSVVKASAGPTASIVRALCPTPGNGTIDVFAETNDLKWTDVEGATNWDVYFGTSVSPPFQINKATRTFSPGTLAANTDYYWKVDAHTTNGIVVGEVWRFRTATTKSAKPFPANGELHAPLRINDTYTTTKPLELTWTPGIGVVSNKVYLGTNATLTEADYRGTVTSPLYAPGQLKYGVTNYWRIDTVKPGGAIATGDVWKFTSDITYSGAGRTEAENMVRNGTYYLENDTGWFAASQSYTVRLEDGPGTVSSIWSGSNSICNVKITYFDESDGTGWYGFYVNETKVDEWLASANNDQLLIRTISNVQLNKGDELRLAAYSNLGELNRTDCMDVEVLSGAPAPPSAPASLVATASDAQVWLNWAASAGATGYIVKRSTTNGGPYASIVTNTTTSYVNTGLSNGTTYYFVVSATNTIGESSNSTQASATPVGGTNSALLAYDGFNYSLGGIGGQAGGNGWAAGWQTTSGGVIGTNTATGLNYGTLVTSGGALQVGYPQPSVPGGTTTAIPERVLPATLGTLASTNGGVLWISFLIYNPTYPTPPGLYYRQSNLGFFSGATGLSASGSEVAALGSPNTSATVPANFAAWGGTVAGAAPNLSSVPSFSTNVQLVLVKLVVDNTTAVDNYYAWFNLNPALLGNNTNTPDISTANVTNSGANLSAVNALRFQAGNYNGNGTNAFYTADELRLGVSFADVTPATAPVKTAPVLSAISSRTINVGVNLFITNNATDADAFQTLTYSLTGKPTNATYNVNSGIFNWRPLVTQADTTNPMMVVVVDNGSPSLSATQSFSVIVNPLISPKVISSSLLLGGQFGLSVTGQLGPDYAIQRTTNLVDWDTLLITNPPTMPFSWAATNTRALPMQFYRIKVGPPLP